jgi:DNA-directed RNA polymerase subunit RPC12/RpoP
MEITPWYRCPYCGSNDIEGGDLEIDDYAVVQQVRCLDCREGWEEIYKPAYRHDPETQEEVPYTS